MAFPSKLSQLCTPAYIYFIIYMLMIVITAIQNMGNSKKYCLGMFSCAVPSVLAIFVVKIIYIFFWTWVLNLICKDGQTGIVIHILQGEREFVKDCRSLARITLKNIPPLKAGYPRLVLKFAIDADGILTVTAYEKSSNIIQRVEIKPSHGMNLAKIEKILSNAYKNAQKDLAKRKEAEQKLEEKYLI